MRKFKVGDIVEQVRYLGDDHRTFISGQEPNYRNTKWKVISVGSSGIKLELVEGTYYNHQPGHSTTFFSSNNYRSTHPQDSGVDQIYEEFEAVSSPSPSFSPTSATFTPYSSSPPPSSSSAADRILRLRKMVKVYTKTKKDTMRQN